MDCEWIYKIESSSMVSVLEGDSLGRIRSKESLGFQLFVRRERE